MQVFVTGASGWVGSAVVPELVAHGHRVTGLARSDASAAAVEAAGAAVVRGSVDDLDVLRDTAAASDAVIHLAFPTDVSLAGRMPDAVATDVTTIRALGDGLAAGGVVAVASGCVGLTRHGVTATERDRPGPDDLLAVKLPADDAGFALAERGLRPTVLRLAPTNHGTGDNGFVPHLIRTARRTGVSGYPGDGLSRWPAVHVRDTARLFRLAIETAPSGYLHAVAEEGVALREIAAVVGRRLGLPTRSVPMDRLDEHFGFLATFLADDTALSSAHTREVTGWRPTGPGLLEGLDEGHYFDEG